LTFFNEDWFYFYLCIEIERKLLLRRRLVDWIGFWRNLLLWRRLVFGFWRDWMQL